MQIPQKIEYLQLRSLNVIAREAYSLTSSLSFTQFRDRWFREKRISFVSINHRFVIGLGFHSLESLVWWSGLVCGSKFVVKLIVFINYRDINIQTK